MSKLVEVTFRGTDGIVYVDTCLLMDDDDVLYVRHETEDILAYDEKGNILTVGVIAEGCVMFEDCDGIFGLIPDSIIYIREI